MIATPANASRRHVFAPAPSPIQRDELRLHDLGIAIRIGLLKDLTTFLERASTDRKAYEWLAYIRLSMVAFGAALDEALNAEVLFDLPARLRTDGSLAWLEHDTPARLRRLVLDPITACLVFRCLAESATTASPKDIQRTEDRILRRIVPEWLAKGSAQRRDGFMQAALAFYRRHMPGVLLSHASGKFPSAAVPVQTLVREAGHRLTWTGPNPNRGDHPDGDQAATQKRQTDTLAPIKRALRAFQPSSKAGGVATGTLDERRQGLDSELADIVNKNPVPGVVGRLVANWLRALIRHGPSKEILETSTLQAYAGPVLEFLATSTGQSLLTVDPEEVEAVFHDRLHRAGSASTQQRTYLVLRHFHDYAVHAIGIEPVEWTEILLDIPELTPRIDANLLYWHEVVAADAMIESASHLSPDVRLLARMYIRLMWATGMRFGECYRLRLMDIARNLCEIYVRSTEHGRFKSKAGERVIPLDNAFDRTGRALLREAVQRAELIGNGDRLTPLACSSTTHRALLPRWQISAVLNEALRRASGDPAVHAHTLRHSRATTLADASIAFSGRLPHPIPTDTVATLLGTTGPSRRTAHAIAQVLGQSSPDVAQQTYIHHAEFRLHRLAACLTPELAPRLLAQLLGKPISWVYKRINVSQADLLQNHLQEQAIARPKLDLKHGVETSTAIPVLTANVGAAKERLSLLHLHYVQRLRTRGDIPTRLVASIVGTDVSRIEPLLDTLLSQANRLGYYRGAAVTSDAWQGASSQFKDVMRAPSKFKDSKLLPVLESIDETVGTLHAAKSFLRRFKREASHLYMSNLDELELILTWFKACGIPARDLGIRCPFVEGKEPSAVRDACRGFTGIQIVDKPASTHRSTQLELHFLEERTWSLPELAHGTFLWICRTHVHATASPAP